MSTVIGLIAEDDTTVIAADSRALGGDLLDNVIEKTVAISPEFVIGLVGQTFDINLLRYREELSLAPPGGDCERWLNTAWVPVWREAAKEYGRFTVDGSDAYATMQSVLLIGVPGELFTVAYSTAVVNHTRRRFAAIGNGTPYALGVLDHEYREHPPKDLYEVRCLAEEVMYTVKRLDGATGGETVVHVVGRDERARVDAG